MTDNVCGKGVGPVLAVKCRRTRAAHVDNCRPNRCRSRRGVGLPSGPGANVGERVGKTERVGPTTAAVTERTWPERGEGLRSGVGREVRGQRRRRFLINRRGRASNGRRRCNRRLILSPRAHIHEFIAVTCIVYTIYLVYLCA